MLCSDELEKEIELQVRKELKNWFESWRNAVRDIMKDIFSGGRDTRQELFMLIDWGGLCVGKSTDAQLKRLPLLEEAALRGQVEKAAWAQIIPRAWNLAGWWPVVIEVGDCDDVGAVDGIIGSKTADDTDVCHDGMAYYLVAAGRPWQGGTLLCFPESPPVSGSPPLCWDDGDDPLLEKLPGTSKLGESTYGNLTMEDVVIG